MAAKNSMNRKKKSQNTVADQGWDRSCQAAYPIGYPTCVSMQ